MTIAFPAERKAIAPLLSKIQNHQSKMERLASLCLWQRCNATPEEYRHLQS
ncbi:MAG: hypothetical protein VKJ64_00995 [Leptolyngbyaceae bacterium]|nr:hypothetical protein [Leptolyngbyaceae bacterium]